MWAVDTWIGDEMAYRLAAELIGSEWTVSIVGAEGGTPTPEASPGPDPPQPTVDGNQLTVHFPVTRLVALARPGISFDWVAVTELNGTIVDRVPDTGPASFPSVRPV
jgi:hypothetical protein